jgi:VWFA-related protein
MRIAVYLFATLVSLSVLSAQSPATPQVGQPIRVGTSLVRVDVYPTRDGKVVPGLQASDFEILEDGAPQKVETFEHVLTELGGRAERADPGNQRDMLQALGNPRHRVFLIFLDASHVTLANAHGVNDPLVEFMTRYVSDDDLVAVMTPAMSVSELTFGRKTLVVEEGLRRNWHWGIKDRLVQELDKREAQYEICFPVTRYGDLAQKMIVRKRERTTLEALEDAVRFLASVRDERKAIVTVSEGWRLYGPDPEMMRQGENQRPIGQEKVHVGRGGTLTTKDDRNSVNTLSDRECDGDRMRLSQIDDARLHLDIIDQANRSNAAFYTIDPGGLRVSVPDRNSALGSLASGTDGLFISNSNDLASGFKKIVDDMSSYYLLGYYSTNAKPDGRFRSITVRVNQPGVQVRARKGYRAPTEEELAVARRVAAPPANPSVDALGSVFGKLGRVRPETRFQIHAASLMSGRGSLWVSGEVQTVGGRPDEFTEGATASIDAVGNGISASSKVSLKPGERTFLVRLDLPSTAQGTVDIRAQLSSDAATSPPLTDGIRVTVGSAELQPVLFRRGVTTGNRLLPAADMRFSRTERLHLEIPVGPGPRDGKPLQGQVLDRSGASTQVPVRVGERTDEGSGQRWITADVTLAALSPADYAIEVAVQRDDAEQKVVTPIRVVR